MAKQHVISTARDFAARAQVSREAANALLTHLDEVAVLVRRYGDVHQVVAYLHRGLEDPGTNLETIAETFGQDVAECVALISKLPAEDLKESRRRRYAQLSKVKATDPEAIALVVAAAGRLANVQNCYMGDAKGRMRKYRQDHRDFRQAVFRPNLADELWTELTELIAW